MEEGNGTDDRGEKERKGHMERKAERGDKGSDYVGGRYREMMEWDGGGTTENGKNQRGGLKEEMMEGRGRQ